MPDAKPLTPDEVDTLERKVNAGGVPTLYVESLIATVRDREQEHRRTIEMVVESSRKMKAERDELQRERDEYLRIIQTDLNVQIDAAEGALVVAGLEDFETLAAGIGAIAKQRDEARKDTERREYLDTLKQFSAWKNKAGGTSFSPDDNAIDKMRAADTLGEAIDAARSKDAAV